MTRYRNGWELNPKSKRGNYNPQQDKRGRKELRPFFLRIVRKGKRNNNDPQIERGQDQEQKPSSQEDKPRTTKAKPQKIGEEDEKRKK